MGMTITVALEKLELLERMARGYPEHREFRSLRAAIAPLIDAARVLSNMELRLQIDDSLRVKSQKALAAIVQAVEGNP